MSPHNTLMKQFFIIFSLIGALALASCQGEPQSSNEAVATPGSATDISVPAIQVLTPAEFEERLASTTDAQLIDVRTPEEVATGKLPGAGNIDVKSNDFSDIAVNSLDLNKPVFVYCKRGSRSSTAADLLESMGFTEIYNMDGGFLQWEEEERPTE